MDSDLEALEKAIGYTFVDPRLLSRALTHSSAVINHQKTDYERLEFLGDAVIDLAMAHLLSVAYPMAREGTLSKMRAALVNAQTLSAVAKELGILPHIRIGRSARGGGGLEKTSIMADVLEAIIGAVYRDSNFDAALQLISRLFAERIALVRPSDPKTELQEALHEANRAPAVYVLSGVEGPEHSPVFMIQVTIAGELYGVGSGATKKAAEQAAAAQALAKIVKGAVGL